MTELYSLHVKQQQQKKTKNKTKKNNIKIKTISSLLGGGCG